MNEFQRIETEKQRMIVTNLIVDDEFCHSIVPILKKNKLVTRAIFTDYFSVVLRWTMDFYQKYNVSPGQDIQEIYQNHIEKSTVGKCDEKLLRIFLRELSGEYERSEKFNQQYAIDQAKLYLRACSLEVLQDQIEMAKQEGDIDKAEELIDRFRSIERATNVSEETDFFQDIEKIEDYISQKKDPLFRFYGELGRLVGEQYRGSFLAFTAPAKRGKSWALIDVAIKATLQELCVVFFNLEMSHEECVKRFTQNYLGEIYTADGKPDEIEIPYLSKVEDGQCEIEYKMVDKKGLSNISVGRKIKMMKSTIRGGKLKIISYPASTLTIEEIERRCDDFVLSGFFADVIVVDFADIMAVKQRGEYRHEINEKWEGLRALANKKHCMVVTASHANKSTFKKDITQSDMNEDYRKINHVTLMMGLNQNPAEKRSGLMRLNVLANRHHYFNEGDFVLILQNLHIGKPFLDSVDVRKVKNYKELVQDNDFSS